MVGNKASISLREHIMSIYLTIQSLFLEDALYKDELRVIKAMKLYNNIRANFMFGWSD